MDDFGRVLFAVYFRYYYTRKFFNTGKLYIFLSLPLSTVSFVTFLIWRREGVYCWWRFEVWRDENAVVYLHSTPFHFSIVL